MAAKTKTHLEASSCHHPHGGEFYRARREKVVQQALSMGFEYQTMTEYPLSWADDQDPFRHAGVTTFMRIGSRCAHRVFESFQEALKDKYEDLIEARGIGIVTNNLNMKLRRPLIYPDSVITTSRITEVRKDRLFATFALWSLQAGAIAAEFTIQMVFLDHQRGRPVDLVRQGDVYADLHADLLKRASDSNRLAVEWEGKRKQVGKL